MFAELSDVDNAYFGKRVKILETIAALRCCVLMLDIGCENLVLEMFNIFFSVVRYALPWILYFFFTLRNHFLS